MHNKNRESAAHDAAVGAAADKPISNCTVDILADSSAEINPNSTFCENEMDMDRVLARINDPNYLHTQTLNQLYETPHQQRSVIIEELLYSGTYILAGAPKTGKSYLIAQLAYHVSTGKRLWIYDVHQGTVLYLSLEDGYQRLQSRMYRMFGVEATDHLHFAIGSKSLGNGLVDQLTAFMREHPDTQLIIIDTLQRVRVASAKTSWYSDDYDAIGKLKQLADTHGICLMLLHHTRKQKADDIFEMISGSTGLMGCADGAFILQKEKRTSANATLDISGRDQPDQKLYLIRDQERLSWKLDHTEEYLWELPPDPLLGKIASILTEERPTWEGSAAELAELLGDEIQPNILTRKLNVKAGDLLTEHGVVYHHKRTRTGSHIRLSKQTL